MAKILSKGFSKEPEEYPARPSMKKILVCNQKGGVGKSLVADELAFSFARTGVPVAFLDLDSQGGTLHKTDQRTDAVVAVIDTPGALQKQMGAWMAEADIIVIPTRTTSRDIEPLLRMMDIVRVNAANKPVLYVLNGWNRWKASSDFRDWFKQQRRAGEAKIVTLPQSEQFVQAGAAGVSVVEYAGRKAAAAKATLEMVNEVRVMAGFEPEEV